VSFTISEMSLVCSTRDRASACSLQWTSERVHNDTSSASMKDAVFGVVNSVQYGENVLRTFFQLASDSEKMSRAAKALVTNIRTSGDTV